MTIRLGSILLHDRSGPLAGSLVPVMKLLDPDPWVRKNPDHWDDYWHMSWVCRWDYLRDEWIVRSIEGKGIVYRSIKSFTSFYYVCNWLPELLPDECEEFIKYHPAIGYDGIGYLFCALNRLTRGVFPAIVDRNLYCWEDVSNLCDRFGRPFMAYGEMPYYPRFFKTLIQEGEWQA
jgi:hypothetical protein